jgi:hypothetical protein
MSYFSKSVIIEVLIWAVGLTVAGLLSDFGSAKDIKTLIIIAPFIPCVAFGLYVFFGKYVFINEPLTKRGRILWGLFFVFLVPIA